MNVPKPEAEAVCGRPYGVHCSYAEFELDDKGKQITGPDGRPRVKESPCVCFKGVEKRGIENRCGHATKWPKA